jgi:Ca-activated chloride channel family protein
MFENFEFGSSYFLLLIPLFIFLNYYKATELQSFYIPHLQFWVEKSYTPSFKTPLRWLIFISIIVAISDPILYKTSNTSKKNTLDIILAIDTSGSMSMYGFNPKRYKQTRLDVVKEVVSKFIKQRVDDRIGLVVFGTHSAIASPLSFDKEAQSSIVQGLQIGILGKSTALIDAIISSIKILKESESQSKILILLSDGEDSSSIVPLPIALKLTKKYGIKVYTIIIDETHSDMMSIIAKAHQTKAYNPKNKHALAKVYQQINSLEKSTIQYASIRIPKHIYRYFLILSFLSMVILILTTRNKEVL